MSSNLSYRRPWQHPGFAPLHLLAGAALVVVMCPAFVSASCVNPGGTLGCYSKIQAAVTAAKPGGTILVLPGTYKEDVVIGKSLSLIGTDYSNTIIDATGLPNGVYVDGRDNPGLSNVLITGFTIKNADYEGVLVTNATNIAIKGNWVLYNDANLNIENTTCPGQPDFETGEDFDCGEGIHLLGVAYSIVANNVSAYNAGGILLSDDTGETHDNLVTGNLSKENPFDCGIVMASHAPGPGSTAKHNGVVHNTISNNTSLHNGFQVPGAGAGVGIFADGSGIGIVSGNLVANNKLLNNGLPGVAFHSHVGPNFFLPPDDLSGNIIINNFISGNGQDLFDTATPGPTGINVSSGGGGSPITGTVIWGNTITNEADDVVTNTPAELDVHFNNLLGGMVGAANIGPGTIDARSNYWGCFGGPGTKGCSTVSGPRVTFVPFLFIPVL